MKCNLKTEFILFINGRSSNDKINVSIDKNRCYTGLNHFMMKRWLFLFIFSVVLSFQSKADQGCFSSSSSYIYIDYYGSSGSIPVYEYRNSADRVPSSAVFCRTNTTNPPKTCYIYSWVSGTSDNYNGTLVNFYYVNCPLDDYIPFILLAIGGLGFFYLRGRNKFAIR